MYTLYQVLGQLLLSLLDRPFPQDQQYMLYARTPLEFLYTVYFFAIRPHELWMAISHQGARFLRYAARVPSRWPWREILQKIRALFTADLDQQ